MSSCVPLKITSRIVGWGGNGWGVNSQENHENCCHQMSDFKVNAPQSVSAWALPQTPLGKLTALPKPPNWNKGDPLLKDDDTCRKGRGGEGGERREVEERRGEGSAGDPCVSLNFLRITCYLAILNSNQMNLFVEKQLQCVIFRFSFFDLT